MRGNQRRATAAWFSTLSDRVVFSGRSQQSVCGEMSPPSSTPEREGRMPLLAPTIEADNIGWIGSTDSAGSDSPGSPPSAATSPTTLKAASSTTLRAEKRALLFGEVGTGVWGADRGVTAKGSADG